MKTRKQYMANECTHREYYGQFVTPALVDLIALHIGRERLLKSTDEHLNDIPLQAWDLLTFVSDMIDRDLLRDAIGWKNPKSFPWSLSDQVCVAKEAARQFIEREKAKACAE